jgi:hypothetical protein
VSVGPDDGDAGPLTPSTAWSDSGYMRWTLSDTMGPRVRTYAWVALASILVSVVSRHRRHIYLVLHALWTQQPVWMMRIAHGYQVDIHRHAEGSAARRNAAQQALIWGERHRAAAIRDVEAQGRNPEFVRAAYAYGLAFSALEAGALERARRFANESLELKDIEARRGMFGGHPPDSDVHAAHIILGLVDLREGHVDGAEEHLRAASRVQSVEPWEATFGPDFRLARDLLRAGRRGAVLEYLGRYRPLWKSRRGRTQLDDWIAAIGREEDPWAGSGDH